MTFLLDTKVLSELRRKRPDSGVVSWIRRTDPATLFISVLSLGEIAKGAARCAMRDRVQAAIYEEWLVWVRSNYAEQIIGIDPAIAEAGGRLSAQRPRPVIDSLLAATALVAA